MSRYVPPLKRVLEEVLSPAGLSASEYPFAGEAPPMPAVAGGAMGKAKKAVAGGAADGVPATGRRLIVIMLGKPTGPPTPLFATASLREGRTRAPVFATCACERSVCERGAVESLTTQEG